MAVVTLTVDGQDVTAQQGQSILSLLREHNIDLPTLCHLEGLSERGGCRLCVVEIEGSSKLHAACITPVQENMVIHTHSERLLAYRKMLLELLLAERNHVCAVCVMNGNCELQRQAAEAGVDHVRYDYLHPELAMDASHARFVYDPNRCVLCTRCVRVCDEIEGAHTWDVMGRGIHSKVIVDLNQPWGTSESCTSCGKCVQICPTGALYQKGASVSEMEKHHEFLQWIVAGRQRHQWSRG
jgi:bidirectional [NiFe] hydrogenase diaphorase subunit